MAGLLLLGADFGESQSGTVNIGTVPLRLIRLLLGRKPPKSEPQAREWPVRTLLVPACRGVVYPGLAGGLSQPFQASWRMAPAGMKQGRDDSAIA